MTSYIDIYNKYFNQEHNATFGQFVYDAFDEANRIDTTNGTNEFFLCMLQNRKCTLDEINLMIDLDANPKYQLDRPFIDACKKCDADVISFFINEYDPDFTRFNSQICDITSYMLSDNQIFPKNSYYNIN